MADRIVEPKGTVSGAGKQLATYAMLARIMQEQDVLAGRSAPDEPQLQLTGDGWRVWGGDVKEPVPRTVAEAYVGVLEHGSVEQAQGVLDMTRERCGELRLAAKRFKGKEAKELEEKWSNLRDELKAAIQIKLEKGITTIS